MFCSNCGTKIADDAKFCYNCGTPVATPVTAPSVSDTETVYPVQTPVQPAIQEFPQESFPQIPQGTIFPNGYSPAAFAAQSTDQAENTTAARTPEPETSQTYVPLLKLFPKLLFSLW